MPFSPLSSTSLHFLTPVYHFYLLQQDRQGNFTLFYMKIVNASAQERKKRALYRAQKKKEDCSSCFQNDLLSSRSCLFILANLAAGRAGMMRTLHGTAYRALYQCRSVQYIVSSSLIFSCLGISSLLYSHRPLPPVYSLLNSFSLARRGSIRFFRLS